MKLYIFKRRSYLGYSKVELERVVDVEQVIGGYRMVDGTYGFLDCQIDYANSFDSECILLENDIGKNSPSGMVWKSVSKLKKKYTHKCVQGVWSHEL